MIRTHQSRPLSGWRPNSGGAVVVNNLLLNPVIESKRDIFVESFYGHLEMRFTCQVFLVLRLGINYSTEEN